MTLHFSCDNQCSRCGTAYIQYGKNIPCPKCGALENKQVDFIPKIIESLVYNRENYGSYVPPVWLKSSFTDHVQQIIFQLFQDFEYRTEQPEFDEFAKEWLSEIMWGDQKFYEQYYLFFSMQVNKKLRIKLEERDYGKLEKYFSNSAKMKETLTFGNIEKILGFKLPENALFSRSWWANIHRGAPTHVWFNAGWKVDVVDMDTGVTFKRMI